MRKRSILYIIIIALAAFGVEICPRPAAAAVSSQEIPFYRILIESDKGSYSTGETAYLNVRLFNGQEPVALDSLEVETVLLQEGEALPLQEYKDSRGTFSCILEADGENPAIEVTVYRKNRHARIEALEARKKSFQNDMARLRDSPWFLFWKRNKINQEIERLDAIVKRIESSIERLNAPLAKISQNILVVDGSVWITPESRDDGGRAKGSPGVGASDDEAAANDTVLAHASEDPAVDTGTKFLAPPDNAFVQGQKSDEPAPGPKKKERISSKESPSFEGPKKVVAKDSRAGFNLAPAKGQDKIIPGEDTSPDVQKEVSPPASYIPVFYSRKVPPVVVVDDTQSNAGASVTSDSEAFPSSTAGAGDGEYTPVVEAVDDHENHTGLSAPVDVDRTPPETESDYEKADIWSKEDARIALRAADAGAGVDAISYRVGGGAFSVYQSPVEIHDEGAQRIQYYARDRLGNREPTKSLTVKIDKTPPVIDADPEITREATGVLTPVTLSHPSIKDNLDSTVPLDTEHVSKEGYPLGKTRVLYRAVDHAGNNASAFTDVNIVDSTPPQLAFEAPAENSYAVHTVAVSGKVRELFLKAFFINGEEVDVVDGQFTKTVSVTEDAFPVVLKAQDTSGNESTVSRTILRDILPPRTAHDYVYDGVWTEGNVRISLSAADEESGVKTTYYREANEPFLEYRRPIDIRKEGKYALEYYSTDAAGNEERRQNIAVRIDRTPPTVKIISPQNGADVSGKTVEVRGNAGDVFLSHVLVNGEPAAVADGNFVLTVPVTQEQMTLTAEAFDEAGHQSSDTVNVSLDISLPVTTDDYAFDNVWVNRDAQIHLTATDAGSGIQATYYRIYAEGTNPPAFVPYNSGNAVTIDQGGKWIVEYYSVDQVGGAESPRFISVLLDKTAPATTDNHGGHIDPTSQDVVIVLAATDTGSGVAAIFARLDQASFAPVTTPITVTQDGTHMLEYYASDQAGNEETRKTLTIPIDKTPPWTTVGSPADGSTIEENTVVIKGAVSSDTVTLTLNGQSVPLVNSTFSVDHFKLTPGKNKITLQAEDGVGNQMILQITVIKVNRPPVLDFIVNRTVYEGETVTFDPTASDPDGDILTFTYGGWMTSSIYAVKHDDSGSHTVTVNVSDGKDTDSQDVTVTVEVCGDGIKNGTEICDEGTSNGTPNHCNAQCAGITTGVCGNNIEETGEACDDGNKTSEDGCSASCVKEICGDGVVQGGLGETCEGNSTKGCVVGGYTGVQTCVASACTYGACAPTQFCGDGVKNGSEVCDDGTQNGSPNKCNTQCTGTTPAVCGNNVKETGEACDDGNKISGDGCSSACKLESCGDGVVQAGLGEQCDDGNKTSGDGCSSTCKIEICGDRVVQSGLGEQCDDGNTVSGDGCNATCKNEFCGDGVKNGTEICDEGTSNGLPNHCNAQCNGTTTAVCGNNIKEGSEGCDDGNKTSGDGCSSSCVAERCGDGIVQAGLGEVCEGNSTRGCQVGGYTGVQTCLANICAYSACATTESCGDGTKNGTEVCDEGANNGTPNHCNAQCAGTTATVCGNGIREDGEGCDDGNKISGDGCSSSCVIEICGDGIVQTALGETCEGNSVQSCVLNGYAGAQSCANCVDTGCVLSEFCGDAKIQSAAGEVCDDGNTTSEDGCSAACKVESCGDGVVQSGLGEQCDDGNTIAGDGCNASCKDEYCGDGIIQSGAGEVCDSNTRACTTPSGYSGTQNCGIQCIGFNACATNLFCGDGVCSSPPETTTNCHSDCPAICGNGIAEPSEECDDHNTASGDGCSAACKLEICGDGIVQANSGEQCDDGNTTNGDGCSSTCQREQVADTTPPSAPAGLSCTTVSASQINLLWGPSSDNVWVTGYRVYRNSAQIGTAANTTYQNTGLDPSSTYTYNVAAYDAAGNVSGQSSAVQCTTQNPLDTMAPSVPTGFTAAAVSSSQIDLSWGAATDNVGVAGYKIYRDGTFVVSLQPSVVSYFDLGLTANTAYSYTVSAFDAAGNESGQSDPASATTRPTTPSMGTVYYVSPAGSDANSGTETLPWKTIQKAADSAKPGDTVYVKAGTYYEKVKINQSGLAGQPIIFEGERGPDGKWLAVIDGSDPTSGWMPAPEIGPGVYKTTKIPYNPYAMIADGDKNIARIHDDNMTDNAKGFMDTWGSWQNLMKTPKDKTRQIKCNDGTLFAEVKFWDGVEAYFGYLNGTTTYTKYDGTIVESTYSNTTFIRFRNGDDPGTRNVRSSPGPIRCFNCWPMGAAMQIEDKHHIHIKNFLIRGAQWGITIKGDLAANNLIEENHLMNGLGRVQIALGAHDNVVRNNKMELNQLGFEQYPPIADNFGATCDPAKYADPYAMGVSSGSYLIFKMMVGASAEFNADSGVKIFLAGINNEIAGNDIFNGVVGLTIHNTTSTKVHENKIHNMAAQGIYISDVVKDLHIYDNLFYNSEIHIRPQSMEKGDRLVYIYRNRTYNPHLRGADNLFFHFWPNSSPPSVHPEFYVYHNSIAGGNMALGIGDAVPAGGMPNVHFINNIFSSGRCFTGSLSSDFYTKSSMVGTFDYNWAGGIYTVPAWFGGKNIKAQGQSMWDDSIMPDFRLPANSSAIDAGIDLSKPYIIKGVTYEPLPGMNSGYFTGTAPDIGAYEYQGSDVITDTTAPAPPANVKAAAILPLSAPSNILSNPGFESGTSPWVFYTNGTGTFAADVGGDGSVYAGHAVVSQPGTNVQLYQKDIALEPNTLYQLSFKAYSNTGHDVSASLQKHGSPYTNYGLSQVFDLTTSWTTYSVQFTTSGFTGTVNDGRLMLWLASYAVSGDEYFFDDVELKKVNGFSGTGWEVNLSWDAATDNVGVAGYKIYRDGTLVVSRPSSAVSYSDLGLTANRTYSYTISAFDAAGNESARSTPIDVTTQASPDTTSPTVPAGLMATAVSANQINLSWTASTDSVGVTGYRIFRNGIQVGTSTTTTYQNTGLSPNTSYSFTVSAYDAAGNESNQSSSASATTQPTTDTTAPSVPAGLTATAASSSQIDLSWTSSTDSVGVTGYRIFRNSIQVATSATPGYLSTGLSANTNYSFTVLAYDAAGNESGQSVPASATTLPTGTVSGDINTLQSRLASTYATGSTANAATYLATQQTDGRWTDIDYTARRVGGAWAPLEHLKRLRVMAIAYVRTGTYYHNAAVLNGISNGLVYWSTAKPDPADYYFKNIGQQLELGPTLIIMEPYLSSSLVSEGAAYMNDPGGSGSNLVDTASETIWRGCLNESLTNVQKGLNAIKNTLTVVAGSEGLQADFSFHQHGPLLYNGGYGRVFTDSLSFWASMTRGLTFAFESTRMDALSGIILDGSQWMVRREYWDQAARGRDITRPNTGTSSSLSTSLNLLIAMGTARKPEFEAFLSHIKGGNDGALTGNKHFWNSDLHVHRRNDYHISVRLSSTRTVGTEYNSGENKLAYYLPFGMTTILRAGDEYYNIYPVWDWARIPGVTSPYKSIIPTIKSGSEYRGTTNFVGGVSDGTYGAVGLDLKLDGVTGRKAWFFFDKEFVALGAGITEGNNIPVFTSLNQTLLKSEVKVSYDGGVGSTAARGQQTLNSPKWVHHDGVGYVFPVSGNVELKSDRQSGNWNLIGVNSGIVAMDVFSLWFDHGANPANAQYEYVVVPGINQSEIETYARDIPVRTIQNTPDIQAVRNDRLGIAGMVFYSAGDVEIRDGLSIRVDRPCVVLVKESAGQTAVTVADPTGLASNVTVTILYAGGISQPMVFTLPGGTEKGRSVTQIR